MSVYDPVTFKTGRDNLELRLIKHYALKACRSDAVYACILNADTR
jgi:hypothetical protein